MSSRLHWAVAAAVAVRIAAALVMIAGPWTDEPSELSGWDVERFQEIADTPGQPYIDHQVEYPPLTVVVAEVVLADEVVGSHQRLVLLSLLVDLATAAVLARNFGARAGTAYLLLGLPMVPSGLLRLDLWAGLAAVVAAAATARSRRHPSQHEIVERHRDSIDTAVFALAVTVGAMVKLWPALLVAAALGIRNVRASLAAAVVGTLAGMTWLAVSGVEALEQVTSLRGVTGWHLESVPGSLIALFTSEAPRLEANAFRIGELSETMVLVGRVAVFGVIAAATFLAWRSNRQPSERLALVMLVSTAALIVTAPLLSPQFLLWLTPWAAIAHRLRRLLALTFATTMSTAVVLAAFGPPDLDHPIAAIALLARDGFLLAIIVLGLRTLARSDWFEYQTEPGSGLPPTGDSCEAAGQRGGQ